MFTEQLLVTRKVPNTVYLERKSIGTIAYPASGKPEAMINLRSLSALRLSSSERNLRHLVARITGIKDVKIVYFPYRKK